MVQIGTIKLNETFKNYIDFRTNKKIETIQLSKINIFVGANNSGKSRFIRYIFSLNDYPIQLADQDQETINKEISNFLAEIKNFFENNKIRIIENKPANIDHLFNLPPYLNFQSDVYSKHKHDLQPLTSLPISCRMESQRGLSSDQERNIRNSIVENANSAMQIIDSIPTLVPSDKPINFYIPVLRGLRPIDEDINKNNYLNQTMNDYFPEIVMKKKINSDDVVMPNIFTGLDFYNRLTNFLLGNNSERKIISEYQNFLSSIIFEGQTVELIPNQKKQRVVVRVGKELEQPIHHLGDGIQSIIILTFLPFITQEPAFFFIEEPEIFLHPGMQRKIIDFFSSNEGNLSKHTFFLTTHSNHFLDLTIDYPDISVFTFRKQLPEGDQEEKEPTFIVQAVDIGDRSTLECLGVRNSSVFLVNATIWVEGITDRKYLREMLRQYIDFHKEETGFLKIEEDVHYSFVEYGGSNITHWSFLDFEDNIAVETLCGKAFVIIDKDAPDKKIERKEELEKKLGKRLKILDAREIENTLPPTVIRKVIAEYEDEGVEIPDFSYEEYQFELLGKFIEEKLGLSKTRDASYKAESGTIAGKVAFCNKALPHIKFEELPKPTKELVELIYNHIKNQNK